MGNTVRRHRPDAVFPVGENALHGAFRIVQIPVPHKAHGAVALQRFSGAVPANAVCRDLPHGAVRCDGALGQRFPVLQLVSERLGKLRGGLLPGPAVHLLLRHRALQGEGPAVGLLRRRSARRRRVAHRQMTGSRNGGVADAGRRDLDVAFSVGSDTPPGVHGGNGLIGGFPAQPAVADLRREYRINTSAASGRQLPGFGDGESKKF